MDSLAFDGWLKGVVRKFTSLNSDEQTETLNELIACCGSEQLWHLQQKLPDFLYRDFILLLPPELTEKILRHLSPSTLLTACRVSRAWNTKISEMDQLWRVQCRLVGCNLSTLSLDYKDHCLQGLKLVNLLSVGRAWEQDCLVNPGRLYCRFSALHHHKGHIAGGTADSNLQAYGESVVIWSVANNRVHVSFPVSGPVSCIKLQFPDMVVCGHFDGTLSSHQVSGSVNSSSVNILYSPGHLIQKYRLHTAPVLSLDFDTEQNILVSGSADCSTKIWELSTGILLKTLASHSHWVLSVIFAAHTNQTIPLFSGRHVLLVMTRDDIQMYSWYPESIGLLDVSYRDLCIPLKSITDAIQSLFSAPGLHFDGQNISFIRQMPFETQTIGDADIVTVDAGSGKIIQSVHINQKIRKLLAIGKRFAVVLLPYVDSKYKNLAIVDLLHREVVGGCTFPHSEASRTDFHYSQVSIGETSWLDGFSGCSTKGLVACMALDHGWSTVIWNTDNPEETESREQSVLRKFSSGRLGSRRW